MILAVDLGTSEFRSLARGRAGATRGRSGKALAGRRCAACYVSIPNDPVLERWIARMNVDSIECEGGRVVLGETAVELAHVLRVPLIPLLWEGQVPIADPVGRQLIAAAVSALIPPRARVAEVVLTLPGNVVDPDSQNYGFLTRLFRGLDCPVQVLHAGTATAFASLPDRQFTGLSINLGAAYCSGSLTRHGQPLVEMTLAAGGRTVNDRLARVRGRFLYSRDGTRYLDLAGIEDWKRTVDLRSDPKGSPELAALRDLYAELARDVARKLEVELSSSRHAARMGAGVPVVLAGGAAAMGGFDALLKEALLKVRLPFGIGRIELLPHDPFTIPRGLLVAQERGVRGMLKRAA